MTKCDVIAFRLPSADVQLNCHPRGFWNFGLISSGFQSFHIISIWTKEKYKCNMANRNCSSKMDSNPFGEYTEEVDDAAFLSHPRQGSSGYMFGNSNYSNTNANNDDILEKRKQLLDERRQIEERTLQSSQRSLGLVYESEKVGVSTAEDLLGQREQLSNVESKLDNINSSMRVSQKHLNSMKSIFGGIKSYFSKSNETNAANQPSINSRPSANNTSVLQSNLEKYRTEAENSSSENHPALARRGLNTSGFRFDDDVDSNTTKQSDSGMSQRSREIDRALDDNLGELGSGLGRLKNLALGLGTEIDEQNDMLDHIMTKAERGDETIQYQNRQMRQILKK